MNNEHNTSAFPNDGQIPYLEHFPDLDRPPQRIRIDCLPFRIGRHPTANYVVHSQRISNNHAQIVRDTEGYAIVDKNSTNGTFVNSKRVTECRLHPNDIIHICHKELRFRIEATQLDRPTDDAPPTCNDTQALTDSLIKGWDILSDVIRHRQVTAAFQPIVVLATEEVIGFETLGRVMHSEHTTGPAGALALADKFQMAPVISRMFRDVALQHAATIPGPVDFFVNVHPSEIVDFSFIDSLVPAAYEFQKFGRQLVLEIPEDAVVNTPTIYQMRKILHKHGILLAFDDFGAGQARLAQLADAAPDFLKLDIHLIRGVDQSFARQDLVRVLAEFAAGLNVKVIAEGVETREEAKICRQLGCHLGQGYLFGRPQPAESYSHGDPTRTLQETEYVSRTLLNARSTERSVSV